MELLVWIGVAFVGLLVLLIALFVTTAVVAGIRQGIRDSKN
jgi:hypothetical protein